MPYPIQAVTTPPFRYKCPTQFSYPQSTRTYSVKNRNNEVSVAVGAHPCPSQQAAHAVRRIPWTSRDPPFMSLSRSCLEDPLDIMGFLGHPGILPSSPSRTTAPCCPEDPLDIPGFLGSFYPRRKITRVRHSFNTSLVLSTWLAQYDYMWFS